MSHLGIPQIYCNLYNLALPRGCTLAVFGPSPAHRYVSFGTALILTLF